MTSISENDLEESVLKLRAKGLSYAKIAEKLSVSEYEVSEFFKDQKVILSEGKYREEHKDKIINMTSDIDDKLRKTSDILMSKIINASNNDEDNNLLPRYASSLTQILKLRSELNVVDKRDEDFSVTLSKKIDKKDI